MVHYIILFTKVLLLLLYCANTVNSQTGRILGGSEVAIYNAPWQVSIQVSARHVCGGAIYSTNIIITAAHCVDQKSVTLIQVRVGANQHNIGGTLMPIVSYQLHEKYNPHLQQYDVALVRLEKELTFSLSVKPIELATTSPESGANVSVSGWGFTDQSGVSGYARTLQNVQLQIITRMDCASSKYGYGWDFVGEEMICAAASNKDACTGDSGGPLVYDEFLAGIVAWGYGCGQANYPGVYVDIAVVRLWIVLTSTLMDIN